MSEIAKKLAQVQAKLSVPKDRDNKFGGFSYRNAEDILRAVKPLLAEHGLLLTLNDTIEMLGNRFYVASTASLVDTETGEDITVKAMAREPEGRTKMDDAQVTGSSSSYARKYALCGLFAIDDSAGDPDAQERDPQRSPYRADGITSATLGALAQVAKERGIRPQDVSVIILGDYGVEKSTALTETQGRELLAKLQAMAVD